MNKNKVLSLVAILVVVALVVASLFIMSSREVVVTGVKNLPWQIDVENIERSEVFSLRVGNDSLAAVTEAIRKIPELAVFQNTDGGYLIEAYFSKVKLGLLRGGFAAEVDIAGVDLAGYAKFDKPGKPMPSGKRKFVLSKKGIEGANELRVWKLAYLPGANYSGVQLQQFFGVPEGTQAVTNVIEAWFYPSKSLVIIYDKEGREIFYYSARKEYQRLVDSVSLQHLIQKAAND